MRSVPSAKITKFVVLSVGGNPSTCVKHAEQCVLESKLFEAGLESCTWPVLRSSHFKPAVVQTVIKVLMSVATRFAWLGIEVSADNTIAIAMMKA